MTEFTLTDNTTRNIDLGNANVMAVTNLAGNRVQVFIDYNPGNGIYASAIKGSAGYPDPFILRQGETKAVNRTDLESEHVRVGVKGDGARIKFVYDPLGG